MAVNRYELQTDRDEWDMEVAEGRNAKANLPTSLRVGSCCCC